MTSILTETSPREAVEPPFLPVRVIEPRRGSITLNLAELWSYRDLLQLLVWRDVSSRYRQTLLGVAWAVIRPVLSVLVFTLVFGYLAKIPSDGIPYPVFSFTALLPWLYFSGSLAAVSGSLVNHAGLLTKVYFPRLVLPLACVVVGLVDFVIEFTLLLVLAFWYGVPPGWGLAVVPLLLIETIAAVLAVGLWLSALNARYRDVTQLVPFVIQIWMYLTPIVYPSSLVPESWRWCYALNPMVGVVDGFRFAVLGQAPPDAIMMAVSLAATTGLLVGGLYFFRRTEETLADIL